MPTINLHLQPTPPFDFELTAGYHAYFQARSGADNVEGGVYRRLLDLDGRLVLVTVRSTGSVDSPELAIELRGEGLTDADGEVAVAQVRWMLGTDQELASFYALAESDLALAGLARQFRGLHLPRTATLFEALVLAILGQQISASVARTMRTLLIERYGARAEFDGATYYAFPRPEAVLSALPEELRELKLSRSKAEYVRIIAGAALEPGWDELYELPDDEVVRRLTALRGVGNWTAQWALVRGLARPDALPLGDLALRRGVSRLWRDGATVTDAEVKTIAERWRPWRSYATAYLFAALRTGMV
ncbi:MAG: DNA-3-methyladenine glycosylase 2 family protein [Chloroflexi bacterium]|nr:DNA-3-methyladenine glycosylase 2 family protein [Chloroflexota bacterium]MYE42182.1 DNA-3-methyladenine glycosylase 2 family protein [Chloroflexota bacterium]